MLSGNTGQIVKRTYIKATATITKGNAVALSGKVTATGVRDIRGIAAKDHAIGDEVLLYPVGEIRTVILGEDGVTAGKELTSDDGKLIVASTAGDKVVAIAEEAGDDGDEINATIVDYQLGADIV